LVGASAAGFITVPVFAPRLLGGPAIGAGLFLLLAGGPPRLPQRPLSVIVARASFLLVGAAFEELLWRSLALGFLSSTIGPIGALALTSIAFALWHHRALGRRSVVHVTTGAGFGAAFLVGGLGAAILAHAVYNVLVDVSVQAQGPRGSRSR
jgi:membrane protease YdiL (CAAX protease family)